MQALKTNLETSAILNELKAAYKFLENVLPKEMLDAFQMPEICLWNDPAEEVRPYYNPKTNQIVFPSNIDFDNPQTKAQVAEWLVHELTHAVLQNYLNNLNKGGLTNVRYITEKRKINAFSEGFSYLMEHLYRYTHNSGVEDLSILKNKQEIIKRLKEDINQDLGRVNTDKASGSGDNAAVSGDTLQEMWREFEDALRDASKALDSLREEAKVSPKEQLEAAQKLVEEYERSNYDIGVFVYNAFIVLLSSS
jgi:hypothetical protein